MSDDRLYLREKDRTTIKALIADRLPGVTVWAYGSRIRGEAHDASDLDLVLRGPNLAPIAVTQLDSFLEALRESNIPILVEARDWARLPASFHTEIEADYVEL